jgi:hypothetical protein
MPCLVCIIWIFTLGVPPRVLSFLPGSQGHVLPAVTHVTGAHLYQEPCTALVKVSIKSFSLGLTEGGWTGSTITGSTFNSTSSSSSGRCLKQLKQYIVEQYKANLQQQQQLLASQASADKVRSRLGSRRE